MHHHPSGRKAFTLIELLVVIAIIAILTVVVIVTLNPAELLRQSRDANRVSDLATLNSAINLYITDQTGVSGFSLGTSTLTYLSIPDPSATTTAGTNCSGLFVTASTSFNCGASQTFRAVNGQGWIPLNFSSISTGAPFGTLPVDPTNNTSSNLYYTYQTDGSTFKIRAVPESQKYLVQAGANPNTMTVGSNLALGGGSWVLVPGNNIFGTNNFWAMKYDAVCTDGKGNALVGVNLDGNGYNNSASACTPSNSGKQIASLPGGNPIVDINQTNAASYCQSIGAHLITNNEWQTITWNAENQPTNWSSGTVGTGYVYSGHNDNLPPNVLVTTSDDTQGYFGETNTGGNQKRTLTLSNGLIIWDMAGNITQWTNDTIVGTNEPNAGPFAWRQFTSITSWGTMTQQTAGPANSGWNSGQGMGQIDSEGTTDPTVYGFNRGGAWYYGVIAGVEMLALGGTPSFTNNAVGFRCTR
jgi:prepilin-type N-terminal cleavage/methylation domain-containing protein